MTELQPYRAATDPRLTGREQTPAQSIGSRQKSSRRRSLAANVRGPLWAIIVGAVVVWWLAVIFLSTLVIKNLQICPFLLLLLGGSFIIVLGGIRLLSMIVGSRIEQPSMHVSSDYPERGGSLSLTYMQAVRGALDVQGIVLKLILRETAVYTSGTDTRTVRHEHVIGQVERPGRHVEKGNRIDERATFDIPPDAMHTFIARHNRLQWFVTVQVNLARWPDFHEIYEVILQPEAIA